MSCFALQGLSNKVSLNKFHLGHLNATASHSSESYDVHIVLKSYSNEAYDGSFFVHILELNPTSYFFSIFSIDLSIVKPQNSNLYGIHMM